MSDGSTPYSRAVEQERINEAAVTDAREISCITCNVSSRINRLKLESIMNDQFLEPMELTDSDLDVVAGGGKCCNRCCDDGGVTIALAVAVALAVGIG
jgi:hypothetical protein